MVNDNLDWIRLRFIITLLGEYHNWWSANVITGKGEEFLSYVLPKTKVSATHQLAVEICRLEHDKQVGPGRFHIFRLPQKWEEQIFTDLKVHVDLLKILPEADLLKELSDLSKGISVVAGKGPILIGANSELIDPAVFRSLAKHYLEAFANSYKTYPYLN